MELLIILSSILRRYNFVLEHPDKQVRTCARLVLTLQLILDICSSRRRRDSCVSQWNAELALSAGAYEWLNSLHYWTVPVPLYPISA